MFRRNRIRRVLLISLGLVMFPIAGCSSESSQTPSRPLRILVTNDDGVSALGIDAVVEALRNDPDNVIVVSAPAVNQSGSGDTTTPAPPPLEATETTTLSGYPATAVMGYPADSVLYALENLYPEEAPDVVLSGINQGQNVGNLDGVLSQISGTVGAAKTAACSGVPALASSQGSPKVGGDYDYEAGVVAVLAWLQANRAALLAGEASLEDITSINIPSCDTGTIRGSVETVLATENPDGISLLGPQDCESDFQDPQDDIEAFFNGFISVTPVPSNSSNTCDDLK